MVGLVNGTLAVFKLNTTSNLWELRQSINTTFTSIGGLDASETRVAACDGGTTGRVQVYYWNYTTEMLDGGLAADALLSGQTVACSALTMDAQSRKIAVGYSNGAIRRFDMQLGSNNTYAATPVVVSGTTGAVRSLMYTMDGFYLFGCRANNIGYVYSGTANTETTLGQLASCQTVDVIANNDELAVGYNAITGGQVKTQRFTITCPTTATTGYVVPDPNTTDSRCTCDLIGGYYFVNGVCTRIDCFTVANRATSVTTAATTFSTTAGCPCATNYIWNSTYYACTLNCATAANAATNLTNF